MTYNQAFTEIYAHLTEDILSKHWNTLSLIVDYAILRLQSSNSDLNANHVFSRAAGNGIYTARMGSGSSSNYYRVMFLDGTPTIDYTDTPITSGTVVKLVYILY